jgi:hypothetical protein
MASFDRSLDTDEQVLAAAMALAGRRLAILTGAGVSTDSGIPDYRGEGTRQRSRQPVRFAEYVSSEHARKRYWARAFVGWPRIRDAAPNITHHVVGALVRTRRATGCITQLSLEEKPALRFVAEANLPRGERGHLPASETSMACTNVAAQTSSWNSMGRCGWCGVCSAHACSIATSCSRRCRRRTRAGNRRHAEMRRPPMVTLTSMMT